MSESLQHKNVTVFASDLGLRVMPASLIISAAVTHGRQSKEEKVCVLGS